MPREETPVEVKSAGPRVVFPPLTAASRRRRRRRCTAAASAGGGGMSDEPKRIRTVSVRPDGYQPRRPRQRRQTAPQPRAGAGAARATGTGRSARADPADATAQRPRSAPRRGASAAGGTRAGRQAAAMWCRCRRSGARPTRRRPTGRCKRKFPSVLGSRQPLIKRADLGDQGRLLPRHDRTLRQPGGRLADVRRPQNRWRAVRRPKKLTSRFPCCRRVRGLIPADDGWTCFHHRGRRNRAQRGRARFPARRAALGLHSVQAKHSRQGASYCADIGIAFDRRR